jgi:hypothetical protein
MLLDWVRPIADVSIIPTSADNQTFLPLNKTHPAMTMVPDRWTFVSSRVFFPPSLHLVH